MKCLITGCSLHDIRSGRWAHGDLHGVGDTAVFNAVVNDRAETIWHHEQFSKNQRIVIICGSYFERRGVIVIGRDSYALSDAAKKHIRGDTVEL